MPASLTIEEKKARVEAKLAERQNKEQELPSGRRKSSTFNGTEGKLVVNKQIEGYHMHIMNDYPGRIDQALESGYEFVTSNEIGGTTVNVTDRNTDLGDKVRFLVGRNESGGPLYAYLMKIKQEWYDEDQAVLQSRNDKIDSSIRKGSINGDTSFYTPREGIRYKT